LVSTKNLRNTSLRKIRDPSTDSEKNKNKEGGN